MKLSRFLKPALESVTETQVEKEHIIWAKLSNTNILSDAVSAEKQEQVTVHIPKKEDNFVGGNIRVRRTEDKEGNVNYTLTLKQKHEGKGNTETSVEVTEDFYVQMSGIAEEKVEKHRYIFPIEGTELEWEVDAAPDGKGGYHPWVRIELEVDDLEMQLPALPFDTVETVLPFGIGELSKDEWEKQNRELFDSYFVTKGPLVKYTTGNTKDELQEEESGDTSAETAEADETNGEVAEEE